MLSRARVAFALHSPIVWAVEMLGAGANPIFLPAKGSKHVILQSFKAATVWTLMTFQGAQLARPNAPIARTVLLPLLRLGTGLVGIIATAAMAAIFTLDASKASAIGGLSDLTPRHIVCYNEQSSFNTAFVTGLASEMGFQTVALNGLSATFDAFFASACDAMIYDETLLQGELIHRSAHTQRATAHTHTHTHTAHSTHTHARTHTAPHCTALHTFRSSTTAVALSGCSAPPWQAQGGPRGEQ